jgi:hypothetical protein
MSDWIHGLPIFWMAVVVFALTYLMTITIYAIVAVIATNRRVPSLKAISPGLLSPLGVTFGLFVVFTAIQVWNDYDRAVAAVNREASSLKSVIVLAGSFPGGPRERLLSFVASHIQETARQEWPMMAHRNVTLNMTPPDLAQGLELILALNPSTPGQTIAQRQIAEALENALDARRQRILISQAEVSFFKWMCILVQAACVLFAIGLLHCDNRLTSGMAMGVFATGVAACLLLIVAYDRPFIGQYGLGPGALLQVLPGSAQITGAAPPSTPSRNP